MEELIIESKNVRAKLKFKQVGSLFILILQFLAVTLADDAVRIHRCYWCGPLAEQVHRSERAPPCDGHDHITICELGLDHCAVVATAPPRVESRFCVKLYQDECYPLFCNTTKTWKMTCPCKGDLCNGPNTERETEAFAVLAKLVVKTHNVRIKRDVSYKSHDKLQINNLNATYNVKDSHNKIAIEENSVEMKELKNVTMEIVKHDLIGTTVGSEVVTERIKHMSNEVNDMQDDTKIVNEINESLEHHDSKESSLENSKEVTFMPTTTSEKTEEKNEIKASISQTKPTQPPPPAEALQHNSSPTIGTTTTEKIATIVTNPTTITTDAKTEETILTTKREATTLAPKSNKNKAFAVSFNIILYLASCSVASLVV